MRSAAVAGWSAWYFPSLHRNSGREPRWDPDTLQRPGGRHPSRPLGPMHFRIQCRALPSPRVTPAKKGASMEMYSSLQGSGPGHGKQPAAGSGPWRSGVRPIPPPGNSRSRRRTGLPSWIRWTGIAFSSFLEDGIHDRLLLLHRALTRWAQPSISGLPRRACNPRRRPEWLQPAIHGQERSKPDCIDLLLKVLSQRTAGGGRGAAQLQQGLRSAPEQSSRADGSCGTGVPGRWLMARTKSLAKPTNPGPAVPGRGTRPARGKGSGCEVPTSAA